MGVVVFLAIVVLALGATADLVRAWVRAIRDPAPRGGSASNLTARTLAVVPAAWIVLFGALVARAWIRIGERPRGIVASYGDGFFFPSHDASNLDPNAFPAHVIALRVALFAVPLCWTLAFVPWMARGAWRERAEVARMLAATAAILAVVAILTLDPGGFWNWFQD